MTAPAKRRAAKATGRATPPKPKRRLRLVKVVVSPVFVLDDGTNITEVSASSATVNGSDWAGWARTAFTPADMARLQRELDTPEAEA